MDATDGAIRRTGDSGMGTLRALAGSLGAALGGVIADWQAAEALVFGARERALLVVAVLGGLAAVVLAWRLAAARRPGRAGVAVPALLPPTRGSRWAWVRHAPFLLALAGLACLGLALADPHTSLSAREVSYPGRRIAVVMDASVSMWSPFRGSQLKTESDTAFSTSMAAADHFVRMRMRGKYRDLIALEQFGSEAYVVTPFTNDYENLLLSLRMISDVREWQRFPDQGTTIMTAIDVGVDLFRAFGFLESAGNLMVIFTDGQDNKVETGEVTLDQVLRKAVEHEVPVYMIRTAFGQDLFALTPDAVWKEAIEATGGKFYPAASHETIMAAIRDIDAAATGRVDVREYRVRQSRFAMFAWPAAACWALAAALHLSAAVFRTFP